MSKAKSFDIFDERYTVVIGKLGGVKVQSNLSYGKELKIYGKVRDCFRFVNLTRVKGGKPESYRLSDIIAFEVGTLEELLPMTEEDILDLLGAVAPPSLLDDNKVIEALPVIEDRYYNKQYSEELEHYTRIYSRVDFNKTSQGYLKFNYKVSTYCYETKTTTNSTTRVFTDKGKVLYSDPRSILDDEREEIIKALLASRSYS